MLVRMNPSVPNLLVKPAWLASRIDDLGTVVLDATLPPMVTPPVDTRARYLAQHIPGAIFFDIDELSDHSTDLPHMLPSAEAFAESMSQMGVGNRQTIVVYEQEGVWSAPRAWWMLRTFGAQDVRILDGGLHAWIEAGLPTESGVVQHASAIFEARFEAGAVKNFAQVQRIIAEHGQIGGSQILDARSPGRFSGSAPDPRPGVSSGHMPGAINVHYASLAEGGRMKPVEKLCELFQAKGVDLTKPITTSCGSGVTAAVISLALELCGAKDVTLYDGSWTEYAQKPDAVIEKTA